MPSQIRKLHYISICIYMNIYIYCTYIFVIYYLYIIHKLFGTRIPSLFFETAPRRTTTDDGRRTRTWRSEVAQQLPALKSKPIPRLFVLARSQPYRSSCLMRCQKNNVLLEMEMCTETEMEQEYANIFLYIYIYIYTYVYKLGQQIRLKSQM